MSYDSSIWPAGKWKGTPVDEVDTAYLIWAAEHMDNVKLRDMAANELSQRGEAVPKPRERDKMDELADRLMRKIGGLEVQVNDLASCIRKLLTGQGVNVDPQPEVKPYGVNTSREYERSERRREPAQERDIDPDVPF